MSGGPGPGPGPNPGGDPPMGFGEDEAADVDEEAALSLTLSDRFVEAAREWADQRVMTEEAALQSKVEQALLEVEHLVSGGQSVPFELDGETVLFEPSDELAAFLDRQADALDGDADAADVLELHVDLFARVFLDDDR